jgi:hypothetical protein
MEHIDMVPSQEKGQLQEIKSDPFPLPACSRVNPLRNHMEECGLHSSMSQGKTI